MSTNFLNNSNNIRQAIDAEARLSCGKVKRIAAHPHYNILVRSDYQSLKDKVVSIISFGGAGHEPLDLGFLGMLTAVVCGQIFASPIVDAILYTILLVSGSKGILLIVKNYGGDRLNLALAVERAKAMGIKVEILLVADDITIEDPKKRRGIGGTPLIHKIAGYYSEQCFSLSDIKSKCSQALKGLFSAGLAISAADFSSSEVIKFEPQIGRGIHNEAGTPFSFQTPDTAKEAVQKVLQILVTKTDASSQYALLINNLGGCTQLEMAVITNEVLNSTFKDRIKYVIGPAIFCSSLNMRGFSLSLLALTDDIEEALLSEVESRAWVQPVTPVEPELIDVTHLNLLNLRYEYTPSDNPENRQTINKICDILIKSTEILSELDGHGGDGDSGETMANMATHIKDELDDNLPLDNPAHLLQAIGQSLSSVGGGTIGVLFSLLFTHAGNALKADSSLNFATALKQGIKATMKYVGTQLGDRTIFDSFAPAIEALAETGNLQVAASAARQGADSTNQMIAKVGRAANVPPEVYLGFNDAGAEAVALIFERLAENR